MPSTGNNHPNRHYGYASKVLARLKAAGLRAEIDTPGERTGEKIRNA
jgi:threonyl-tRNA synthetase